MSDQSEVNYVWAVEWDNPFDQQNNRGMVLHEVTLRTGVTEEHFLEFVTSEGFPAVDRISTRAIRYGHQYLLRRSTEQSADALGSIQDQGVAAKLKSLCTQGADTSFFVLADSATKSTQEAGS
jgi:hypothetical protein